MPFIGRQPVIGNFQKCDSISVVNGQAAYTLQVGGVNVSPQSENHMLVSLNGILQSPVTSFTVSNSTITFASNLVTGDVIDFIMILGNVLDLGVPSDNTVSTAKLADSSVTTAKITDANVTSAKMFSGFANGITEADCWRMTTDITGSGADLTLWERDDDAAAGYLGTGMSQSSGIFTFPSTGIWYVNLNATVYHNGNGLNFYTKIDSTIDNSSYSEHARARAQLPSGGNGNMTGSCNAIIDVTNTSNVKVKFSFYSGVTDAYVQGNSSINITAATFIRLGDT